MKYVLLLSAFLASCVFIGAQEDETVVESEQQETYFDVDDFDIEAYEREHGKAIYHDPSWLEVQFQEILGMLGEYPPFLRTYIMLLEYRNQLVSSDYYQVYEEKVKKAHQFNAIMRVTFGLSKQQHS